MGANCALDLGWAFVELFNKFILISRVIRPNPNKSVCKAIEMTEFAVFSVSDCSIGVEFLFGSSDFDSNFMVFFLFFLVHEKSISVKKNFVFESFRKVERLAWGRRVSHFELVLFP